MFLADCCFPGREFYAPMDAAALPRYRILERLGIFGIGLHSPGGAARFLDLAERILQRPNTSLWLTPEGRFSDVRETPTLQPGLGHLVGRLQHGLVVPVAVEYTFWQERLPEALTWFGEPLAVGDFIDLSRRECTARLTDCLQQARDELAAASIRRDASAFRILLHGKAGFGGLPDLGRSLRCRLTGQPYHEEHGVSLR